MHKCHKIIRVISVFISDKLVDQMSFTKLGNLMNSKFNQSPLKKKITAALVCEEFDKIMFAVWGEKIKKSAQTMYLKDKVLSVAVLSSVVAQELKLRETELIEKINSKFGERVVERLRFLQ